jgi:diguanylate cyclase (GGDEF)-like protein
MLVQARRADISGGAQWKGHLDDTIEVAERIRQQVSESKIEYVGKKIWTTISVSLSCYDGVGMDFSADDFVEEADKMLYEAKTQRMNRVCVYGD